jgi:hypothetical protein
MVKSYWFPAKRYGWGWGPPTRWQGWVVLLLWAAALLEGLYLLRHGRQQLPFRIAFISIMIIILTLVCYWKGEPPNRRWENRSE